MHTRRSGESEENVPSSYSDRPDLHRDLTAPGSRFPERIAHAAHGVDQLGLARVHLQSQQPDERLQRVLMNVAVESPDRFQDRLASYHPSRIPEQEFEQTELARSQIQRPAAARRLAGRRIEFHIRRLEDNRVAE